MSRKVFKVVIALVCCALITVGYPISIHEEVTHIPSPISQQTLTPSPTPTPTPTPTPELISLWIFTTYGYDICQDCCGKSPSHPAYGLTATETKATEGRTIAVDPSVIPLGTEVIIKGHTYIAEDTGSGIVGRKIDICYSTHKRAKAHGIQEVEVFIRR